jgi:hypothetical protein
MEKGFCTISSFGVQELKVPTGDVFVSVHIVAD